MKFNWPKYDIMKNVNGEDVLYLRRYFIFRSKFFNIFLHFIPREDVDVYINSSGVKENSSHNHPWSFLSFILRGGYTEAQYSDWKNYKTVERKLFSFGFRKAEDFHKIISVRPNTYTLVITGSIINKNDWGFSTSDGFIHWRKFLGITGEVDMD